MVSRSPWLATVIPSTSDWMRPLKRSTIPLVLGVYGRVLRCSTPSVRQAASNPAAVKQEPPSVSTWVTWKGKAWTASFRKATALGVGSPELGQGRHVHVHEAEIVRLEAAMRSAGAISWREAAQALGFQDAVDCITVEMGQEVGDHKGEVIQGKARGTPQGADNGALFLGGFPGQLVRSRGAVLAAIRSALAPLADGFGGNAVALGQAARGLARAGDLGADGRGGAGVGMDRG